MMLHKIQQLLGINDLSVEFRELDFHLLPIFLLLNSKGGFDAVSNVNMFISKFLGREYNQKFLRRDVAFVFIMNIEVIKHSSDIVIKKF